MMNQMHFGCSKGVDLVGSDNHMTNADVKDYPFVVKEDHYLKQNNLA